MRLNEMPSYSFRRRCPRRSYRTFFKVLLGMVHWRYPASSDTSSLFRVGTLRPLKLTTHSAQVDGNILQDCLQAPLSRVPTVFTELVTITQTVRTPPCHIDILMQVITVFLV
ncbi:hypothetical protein M404DRAFT_522512 [Pisolithus tinctorius Marx 270]|uniref:Uncharacterized protein n=1 Tax=Pisolithus tinctorius Marx 270 TaxID=870435 RepID=A0A0C3J8I9_PISTI|nr:hypothetical protein M404DRAFT_522512 [Pisolithus tinctorius Marx 270]